MRGNDKGQDDSDVTRRNVVKGIGGLAALSMSNATMADARNAMNNPLPTDPHTRATYRAIVDAIVPRTPDLADELGSEHVPGGLEVELEKFIIWDFNHFQEIRLETLTTPIATSSDGLASGASLGPTPASDDRPDALMDPDLFRVELDPSSAPTDAAALASLADVDGLDAVEGVTDAERLNELVDFGPVERFEISFANTPVPTDAEGPAEFDVVVETGNDAVHRVLQNYPYAPLFPFVFDLVAAEFVLRGQNEDALSRDPQQFPGGGTFVRLSREDRLRCLWTIVDGSVLDRLDALLSPMLPQVGILKYVVMAVNGLHGFGYYTEWSGYGETKTAMPTDREMAKPPDRVQSRTQTDYPGPEPGYAADWRHVIDGGFADPTAQALDLPQDLEGEDVLDGIGGDGQ